MIEENPDLRFPCLRDFTFCVHSWVLGRKLKIYDFPQFSVSCFRLLPTICERKSNHNMKSVPRFSILFTQIDEFISLLSHL
jgi:hypothetical protein